LAAHRLGVVWSVGLGSLDLLPIVLQSVLLKLVVGVFLAALAVELVELVA
jgi:hypothetical protein